MPIWCVQHVTQNALIVMDHRHTAYRARVGFTITSTDVMQVVRSDIILKMARQYVPLVSTCV